MSNHEHNWVMTCQGDLTGPYGTPVGYYITRRCTICGSSWDAYRPSIKVRRVRS